MNFIKENWLNLITVLLSLAALIFSIYSHFNNIQLQEKYDMLNTYAMTLNYQVEISETEGNLKFGDIEISKACINITPKTGGIEKIYAIHYYKNNVKAVLPVELYTKGMEHEYDAQNAGYNLNEYTIDCIAESSSKYYGTLYLLVKDYQNNYFTNMIIYEIDKENISNIQTRIYSDIDLLHTYNKELHILPEFDANQMSEYQNLKEKLSEIL